MAKYTIYGYTTYIHIYELSVCTFPYSIHNNVSKNISRKELVDRDNSAFHDDLLSVWGFD